MAFYELGELLIATVVEANATEHAAALRASEHRVSAERIEQAELETEALAAAERRHTEKKTRQAEQEAEGPQKFIAEAKAFAQAQSQRGRSDAAGALPRVLARGRAHRAGISPPHPGSASPPRSRLPVRARRD